MAHILLLEDDKVLGKNLSRALELEGFTADWAECILDGKNKSKAKLPDLYLLDWQLPDGTGIEWASEIRKYDTDVPIVFLTARTDHESAVQALSKGANDFIRKPFGYEELFLRIKKALREVIQEKDFIRYGELALEKNQMKAFFKDTPIHLTAKEYEILELLCKKAESIVSRESIALLLKNEGDASDRTVDSHISHIRKHFKKLGMHSLKISSVYGIGYKLEKA